MRRSISQGPRSRQRRPRFVTDLLLFLVVCTNVFVQVIAPVERRTLCPRTAKQKPASYYPPPNAATSRMAPPAQQDAPILSNTTVQNLPAVKKGKGKADGKGKSKATATAMAAPAQRRKVRTLSRLHRI